MLHGCRIALLVIWCGQHFSNLFLFNFHRIVTIKRLIYCRRNCLRWKLYVSTWFWCFFLSFGCFLNGVFPTQAFIDNAYDYSIYLRAVLHRTFCTDNMPFHISKWHLIQLIHRFIPPLEIRGTKNERKKEKETHIILLYGMFKFLLSPNLLLLIGKRILFR